MKRAAMDNAVLQWRLPDHEQASLGEGVSRPKPGQKTRMYRVVVRFATAKPMTAILPAASKRDALKYAKNRWPMAECLVVGIADGS
jgi:hypothetical protein